MAVNKAFINSQNNKERAFSYKMPNQTFNIKWKGILQPQSETTFSDRRGLASTYLMVAEAYTYF